tara:strand:+ start:4494 stop:5006 length:513 start_codon:yes stop_codon:yes gene_type:complete
MLVPRACAVCQLGGLIYFTLIGIIALVLVNCLPLINLICQLLFDGCVACTDAVKVKAKPIKLKRPAALLKAPSARVKGSATSATSATASSVGLSAATDVTNAHLTAQQLRAAKRARRRAMGQTGETFGERLRRLGRSVIALGSSQQQQERAVLLPQQNTVSPPAPPETWA